MFCIRKNRCARNLGFAALSLAALGSVLPAFAYIVKNGDTLSQIAREHLGLPIYGKSGSLARLKNLNPSITNPNFVVTGESIVVTQDLALVQPHDPLRQRAPATMDGSDGVAAASATVEEAIPSKHQADHRTAYSPEVASDESSPFSRFSLRPTVGFTRLDGTDSGSNQTALIFSDLSPGFELAWDQVWSDNYSTSAEVKIARISMLNASEKEIANRAQWYSGFEVSGARRFTASGLNLGLAIGLNQEIYYRATTLNALTLDKVLTPYTLLQSKIPLVGGVDQPGLGLSLAVHGGVLWPGNSGRYSTRLGYNGSGAIHLHHRLQTIRFELGLVYVFKKYESAHVSQTRQDLQLSFGASIDVGRAK